MSEVDQGIGAAEVGASNQKRKLYLMLLILIFLVIALAYGVYWATIARFYQETDNAYVNGNIIPVSSQVGGTIVAVKADDTQFVRKGQLLVELDPIDSYLAFEEAKADLVQTLRNTQRLFINNKGLQAGIRSQEVSLQKARLDLQRRNQAIGLGAVSQEELVHAQDRLKTANASLTQAHSALLANQALIENTTLIEHPNHLVFALSASMLTTLPP